MVPGEIIVNKGGPEYFSGDSPKPLPKEGLQNLLQE